MHDGPVLIGGSPRRWPRAPAHGAGDDDIRLTLPANARNVVLVRQVVTCLAEALDLPGELVQDIRLAVTEACTNVVRHAYSGTHGPLEVCIAREPPEALCVVVSDRGCGLRPQPNDEGPGLGLPLIGALAHALEIEHRSGSGSQVRMRFLIGDG